MSVSALVKNVYFPLSAPHTNLCLPVPVPVFDSTILSGGRPPPPPCWSCVLCTIAHAGVEASACRFAWLSPGTVLLERWGRAHGSLLGSRNKQKGLDMESTTKGWEPSLHCARGDMSLLTCSTARGDFQLCLCLK